MKDEDFFVLLKFYFLLKEIVLFNELQHKCSSEYCIVALCLKKCQIHTRSFHFVNFNSHATKISLYGIKICPSSHCRKIKSNQISKCGLSLQRTARRRDDGLIPFDKSEIYPGYEASVVMKEV